MDKNQNHISGEHFRGRLSYCVNLLKFKISVKRFDVNL